MNKYQKALDTISNVIVSANTSCYKKEVTVFREFYTLVEDLQELVNKETPTKPILENYTVREYSLLTRREIDREHISNNCPLCKRVLSSPSGRCSNCGQRIKWGNR